MKKGMSQNRKKELEYFAKQYFEWVEYLDSVKVPKETNEFSDPTGEEAVKRVIYDRNIRIVNECILLSCPIHVSHQLLLNVVNGDSYENLVLRKNLKCGRRQFYEYRAIFFNKLSQKEHMY